MNSRSQSDNLAFLFSKQSPSWLTRWEPSGKAMKGRLEHNSSSSASSFGWAYSTCGPTRWFLYESERKSIRSRVSDKEAGFLKLPRPAGLLSQSFPTFLQVVARELLTKSTTAIPKMIGFPPGDTAPTLSGRVSWGGDEVGTSFDLLFADSAEIGAVAWIASLLDESASVAESIGILGIEDVAELSRCSVSLTGGWGSSAWMSTSASPVAVADPFAVSATLSAWSAIELSCFSFDWPSILTQLVRQGWKGSCDGHKAIFSRAPFIDSSFEPDQKGSSFLFPSSLSNHSLSNIKWIKKPHLLSINLIQKSIQSLLKLVKVKIRSVNLSCLSLSRLSFVDTDWTFLSIFHLALSFLLPDSQNKMNTSRKKSQNLKTLSVPLHPLPLPLWILPLNRLMRRRLRTNLPSLVWISLPLLKDPKQRHLHLNIKLLLVPVLVFWNLSRLQLWKTALLPVEVAVAVLLQINLLKSETWNKESESWSKLSSTKSEFHFDLISIYALVHSWKLDMLVDCDLDSRLSCSILPFNFPISLMNHPLNRDGRLDSLSESSTRWRDVGEAIILALNLDSSLPFWHQLLLFLFSLSKLVKQLKNCGKSTEVPTNQSLMHLSIQVSVTMTSLLLFKLQTLLSNRLMQWEVGKMLPKSVRMMILLKLKKTLPEMMKQLQRLKRRKSKFGTCELMSIWELLDQPGTHPLLTSLLFNLLSSYFSGEMLSRFGGQYSHEWVSSCLSLRACQLMIDFLWLFYLTSPSRQGSTWMV